MVYTPNTPTCSEETAYHGLGVINASEVPGLPVFGPGIVWPDFVQQARDAFYAYATRNTGGQVGSVDEYNAIMGQAEDWANAQVAGARISGADIYWRSLETPALGIMVAPTNTAVPDQYKTWKENQNRYRVLGHDIIRAWEDGNPITWMMLDQGRAEWEAVLRGEAAEEAARIEAEEAAAAQARVEALEAGADAPVVEATPTVTVTVVEGETPEEEAARLEAERLEAARLEAERLAAEEEAARLAAEEEAARLEAEAEAARLEAEAARLAADEGRISEEEAAAAEQRAREAEARAAESRGAVPGAPVVKAGLSSGVLAALVVGALILLPAIGNDWEKESRPWGEAEEDE